jgi:hypothetical protein
MRIKPLGLVSGIAIMLLALGMISSCAFASANNLPNRMCDVGLCPGGPCPGGNVTEENFTDVQTSVLDSINKQITELQGFYTNVSEASNATELQEVLCRQRADMWEPEGMNREHRHMSRGPFGMNGFNLDAVVNVTDENYTDVQTEIIDSLGNMTNMLNDQLNDTKVSQDSNRTAEINERLTELQTLSTEVSEASTATELKEVIFTYMQTQAIDSIEKEIEHLQTKVNDSENVNCNTTEVNSRITELTTLKGKISGAESLDDLKTIMSSYIGCSGMRDNSMQHREPGEHKEHCKMQCMH